MTTEVKARLCFVEDDPTIQELVTRKLLQKGYSVDAFLSAEPLLALGPKAVNWDLFIVDILLSGQARGLDLCQHIRSFSPMAPVLIVSALSEPSDRVEGLRQGADDYLTKPFEMEELILRVQGMLRRRSWYGEFSCPGSVYYWQDNQVDFAKLEGKTRVGKFSLTPKEAMLMKLLVEKQGEVVSRNEILDRVWGYDVFPSIRTVDNFIVRLRRYFEPEPGSPVYIHSVRGLGYKFTPDVERNT